MFNKRVYQITEIASLFSIDRDSLVYGALELTKSEVIERFRNHVVMDSKERARVFIPALFKDDDDWVELYSEKTGSSSYRNDSNIASMSLIVLDIDYGKSIDEIKDRLSGFEYIIHSTFSYSSESNNYRLILFPSENIPAAVWPTLFRSLSTVINVDPACKNLSRVYFYPSIAKSSDIEPFFEYVSGKAITVDDILAMQSNVEPVLHGTRSRSVSRAVLYHPSGGVCSAHYRRFILGVDDEYSSLCEMFKYQVINLKKSNSNHNFALTVIKHAIEVYGRSVEWLPVLSFIFYQAKMIGKKDIFKGNTDVEIADMVFSGYQKFAPDELRDAEDMAVLSGRLSSCISQIRSSAGDMLITVPVSTRSNSGKFNIGSRSQESSALDVRYLDGLLSCFKSGKGLAVYISSVCKKEYIRVGAEKYNPLNLFVMILKSYLDFAGNDKLQLKRFVDRFSEHIESGNIEMPSVITDKQKVLVDLEMACGVVMDADE